jgi:hypothetical protein
LYFYAFSQNTKNYEHNNAIMNPILKAGKTKNILQTVGRWRQKGEGIRGDTDMHFLNWMIHSQFLELDNFPTY